MLIREVTIEELDEALAAGAHVVDVREIHEYVDGHVPGAVLVPLGTVPGSLHEFRSSQVNYVICKSGGRSMRACEFLATQGYEAVNVNGGTMAWAMSGREIVAEVE